MTPRFACADYTFPLLEHGKVLDLIRMLDFSGVDIGLFEDRSHLQPSTEFANIKTNAAKLKSALSARSLTPTDLFLQTSLDFEEYAINHPDKDRRTYARGVYSSLLGYASACGCEHVTVLPGVDFGGDAMDRCVEELAWRVDEAKKAGVVLAVEAHLGSIVPNPPSALRLMQAVPGLTLALDLSHFIKTGLKTEDCLALAPYASHVHVRGARKGEMQTPLSLNEVDHEMLVRELVRINYTGGMCVEYVWQDWEGNNRVDTISEGILLRRLLIAKFEKYGG